MKTEKEKPKSCYDCKHSAFGVNVICVVSDKLLDVYDFDKSISPQCPKHLNKKLSLHDKVIIENEIEEIEKILEENSETINFKIENGIRHFINGYEVRDLENRLSELKKKLR